MHRDLSVTHRFRDLDRAFALSTPHGGLRPGDVGRTRAARPGPRQPYPATPDERRAHFRSSLRRTVITMVVAGLALAAGIALLAAFASP